MKVTHSITSLALAVLVMSTASCTQGKAIQGDVATKEDSIIVNNKVGEFSIKAACPTDSSAAITTAINEFLSETLGGSYDGSLTSTMPVMKFYLNKVIQKDSADLADLQKEGLANDRAWKYEFKANIDKIADTPNYVTYLYTCYEYQGGAHGGTAVIGQTFRKADGRRIGWEVFTNVYDEGFQNLLKQGLMRFWKLKNDSELQNALINPDYVYQLPLPQCGPLFMKDGIRIVYGQYEIAPYAAGMPDFTIPYNQIQKFMKVTAKNLVQ